MKYAFINNNRIEKIEDTDEQAASAQGQYYQQIVPIDGLSPAPHVGWIFDNGVIFNNIPDVTPRQFRQALIISGVPISLITDALSSLPEPMKSSAMVEWEYSVSFKRNRQLVVQMGAMLGWTSEQLDNLWLLAGKL